MNARQPEHHRAPSSLALVQGPDALRTFTRILYFTLAATVLALFLVPWQQNVSAAGHVSALDPFDRIQTIAAPVSGRVLRAWVAEGTRVEEGDRLLEIIDLDPEMVPRLEQQVSTHGPGPSSPRNIRSTAVACRSTVSRESFSVIPQYTT